MIQQTPFRNGNPPEGKNTYTKFWIGLDDNESSIRRGLYGRVSVMDIVELFWKLSVNNFDV
jgi:hypothetical protein